MHTDDLLSEIEAGEGQTLSRLARLVPRTRQDRPASLACLLRWVLNGVPGPDGERVYLEAVRWAGKWVSSPSALRRFVAAQTPQQSRPPANTRTIRQRRRDDEAAERELEKLGI
jgi:hypothetical protein